MRRLFLALAAAALAACARSSGGPPNVQWGRDACARCGMILSEERFASGYVAADGTSVVFDDIGEFLAARDADPGLAAKSFVQDAGGRGWLPASAAVFVNIPGLATPMGSGWAAFGSNAEAAEFAARLKAKRGGPEAGVAAR